MQIKIDDPAYPAALRALPNPPTTLTTSGPLEAGRAVAIVGSRRATEESLGFAFDLAFQLAKAGIIVVSGGAKGVDGAAHRGAMAGGGTTWVVSPTGKDRVYPPQHAELFEAIARSEQSRMIWCFPDDHAQKPESFRYRNGVLAALTEGMVVVQAHYQSGSRNAAAWARSMERPVWAVSAAPWMSDFAGTLADLEHGLVEPLWSSAQLFRILDLPPPAEVATDARPPQKHGRASFSRAPRRAPPKAPDMGAWSAEEKLVFSRVLRTAAHVDEIAGRTGLPAASTATALLTLSLKDVVVEGPDRFFRRRSVT